MATLNENQTQLVTVAGPREKLRSLLETVLKDSRINAAFRPVIMQLANNFLDNTTDEEIVKGVSLLRDTLIPWVLGDEDTHPE
jgi:hypothetical protein